MIDAIIPRLNIDNKGLYSACRSNDEKKRFLNRFFIGDC